MLREGGPQMMNHYRSKSTIPWEGVVPFPLASGWLRDSDVAQSSREKGNSEGEVLGKVFLSDKYLPLVKRRLPSFN